MGINKAVTRAANDGVELYDDSLVKLRTRLYAARNNDNECELVYASINGGLYVFRHDNARDFCLSVGGGFGAAEMLPSGYSELALVLGMYLETVDGSDAFVASCRDILAQEVWPMIKDSA